MINTISRKSSSNSPPIDADLLRSVLDAQDHRQILSKCGFSLDGRRGTELQGVHGPEALGEGENGNFSVNLDKGVVKDWGSTGYEGHVFDVVQDVEGLSFTEALNWIVEELRLDVDELTVSGDGHSSQKPPTPPSRPEPRTSDPDNGEDERTSQDGSDEPESVAEHDRIQHWGKRLRGDTGAGEAARAYLCGERGIHPGILQGADVGLAHEDEIPDDWSGFYAGEARSVTWWIVFPVPRRDVDGEPIVAVKGVGFAPSSCDWKRDSDGQKIPRNVGSALWDLVPTDSGEPRIDSPLIVCEGEVDALCAVSNGFNAVTGTAGAGTFKPEWASYTADLTPTQQHGAVVAYDGDETGRQGAQTAAQRLSEAGAEVKVATLPDGADVNDVLLDGGAADLHAHVVQADTFEPETIEDDTDGEDHDGPDVQPLLGTEEPPPMEWRVSDFVPEDHLTMLIGDGGTGKSVLALHLSLCIATGRPFLGMGTREGRVLYVDHELERDEQLRRVHRISRGMGLDASDSALSDRFLYWRPRHPLGSREHQEQIMGAVQEHSIDLVILDSLTMGAQGDVTDVADVVPIMQDVRQWPTTVAIDHVSHSTAQGSASQARAFGSVFKRNAARSSLTLAQADTGGYCIQQEKSNFSEGDGRLVYAVEWGEDEITFEGISDADERAAGLLSDLSSKDVTAVAVEEMWDVSNQPVMPSDVVTWRQENVEDNKVQTEKAVRNHFSALKRREKITTDQHGGAMPAKAKHEPPSDTSDEDVEAPF